MLSIAVTALAAQVTLPDANLAVQFRRMKEARLG